MIYAVPCSFIHLVHVYFVYKCKFYTIIQITETEPAADNMEDDMDEEEKEEDDDYEAATDLFNTFLNEKDDQDNMDGFLDEMSVWENVSMFTREWIY